MPFNNKEPVLASPTAPEIAEFPYKNAQITAWGERVAGGKFAACARVESKYGPGGSIRPREFRLGGRYADADEAARAALGHVMEEIDEGSV